MKKPGEMVALAPVELHWGAKYVFFAEKAGEVRFRARQVPKDPGAHFLDAFDLALPYVDYVNNLDFLGELQTLNYQHSYLPYSHPYDLQHIFSYHQVYL